MKISRPKRVSSANAGSKEAREALDTTGVSVNTFMNEAYIAIMGRLSVNDNLNMAFVTVDVNVDGSGNLNRPVRFKSGLTEGRAVGCPVMNIINATPVSAPFVTFTEDSGVISITNVTGLAADTNYQLVLLIVGG